MSSVASIFLMFSCMVLHGFASTETQISKEEDQVDTLTGANCFCLCHLVAPFALVYLMVGYHIMAVCSFHLHPSCLPASVDRTAMVHCSACRTGSAEILSSMRYMTRSAEKRCPCSSPWVRPFGLTVASLSNLWMVKLASFKKGQETSSLVMGTKIWWSFGVSRWICSSKEAADWGGSNARIHHLVHCKLLAVKLASAPKKVRATLLKSRENHRKYRSAAKQMPGMWPTYRLCIRVNLWESGCLTGTHRHDTNLHENMKRFCFSFSLIAPMAPCGKGSVCSSMFFGPLLIHSRTDSLRFDGCCYHQPVCWNCRLLSQTIWWAGHETLIPNVLLEGIAGIYLFFCCLLLYNMHI